MIATTTMSDDDNDDGDDNDDDDDDDDNDDDEAEKDDECFCVSPPKGASDVRRSSCVVQFRFARFDLCCNVMQKTNKMGGKNFFVLFLSITSLI